jgi:hypothetical protein
MWVKGAALLSKNRRSVERRFVRQLPPGRLVRDRVFCPELPLALPQYS